MKRVVAWLLLLVMAVMPAAAFAAGETITEPEEHSVNKIPAEETITAADEHSMNENAEPEKTWAADKTFMNEKAAEEKIKAADEHSKKKKAAAEKVEEPEDSYVIDFTDEEFDLMCVVVEAEAGGCSVECRRWVADVIINRTSEYGSIEAVLMAPHQFSCVWDGGIERHSKPQKSTVKVCRQELKEVAYPGLWYFRDDYYHSYGTPWRSIDNMFFSTK